MQTFAPDSRQQPFDLRGNVEEEADAPHGKNPFPKKLECANFHSLEIPRFQPCPQKPLTLPENLFQLWPK
jgi:hypothetical protein